VSDERVERILDAAYACFTRHGIRRTTMDDIAAAADMSRPAVYQYVRNKDDAFRRLAARLFDDCLVAAREGADTDGPLAERLHRILAVKLELTLRLAADSPHAAELLDAGARLSGELVASFESAVRELVAGAVTEAAGRGEIVLRAVTAADLAQIVLAMVHGLEKDLTDPDVPRARLRQALDLLTAGLRPS
jgi:TetR/AcrR family transcriptional regulator